jgi:hypothetical protein
LSLKNVLVVLVATLASLGLTEVTIRMLVPDPYLQFENRVDLFQEDNVAGYKNQPDFRGYAQGVILVRTNHLGYRGAEVSRQKDPKTFRILRLGDSVTWGVGVQEDGIYLTILESMLNEPGSPTRRFETVNTAVIGYSLHQELLTLERDGVALSPDVVLLGFVVNDFYPTEDPFFNIHKFHQPAKEHVRRREYKEPVRRLGSRPRPGSHLRPPGPVRA